MRLWLLRRVETVVGMADEDGLVFEVKFVPRELAYLSMAHAGAYCKVVCDVGLLLEVVLGDEPADALRLGVRCCGAG